MRRAWLSAMAGLCAALVAAGPVAASPAGMSMQPSVRVAAADPVGKPATKPAATMPATPRSDGSWTDSLAFWRDDKPAKPAPRARVAAKPSKQYSPWRQPVRYFTTAMSETPIAKSLAGDDAKKKVPQANDSIALDKPTGPPTPPLMISLAQASERQGNIDQARRQFQQAITQWPNDVEVLRATARMEDRLGQLPTAEILYQRAVQINPQHAGAHNDLGLCLARQGKLDASISEIEQAIHLQPDKALYRNNAATVLVELREDQRALAHLSAVHGSAVASYNLGQLLVQRGRPQDAVTHFQTAVNMDPTMEPARVALAQVTGTPVAPKAPTPSAAPQPSESQLSFPATARGPRYDTSGYVPPASYQPATTVAPQAPAYQTATAPRYLPPVPPATPGSVVR